MMAMTIAATMMAITTVPMVDMGLLLPARPRPRHLLESAEASASPDLLELARLLRQRGLHRQALHAGGAVEAVAVGAGFQDEAGIRRRGDGSAMTEHDDVLAPRQGRGRPGVDARHAVRQ